MKRTAMEITTKMGCKIGCRYCPQGLLLNKYFEHDKNRESVMDVERFKRMIDKIPNDVEIHFSGMCEPWANPKCTEMVEYASQKGHIVDIYTTLVGMTMDDYKRIRELPIRYFVLHVPDKDGNSAIQISKEYLSFLDIIVEDVLSDRFMLHSISSHGEVHPQVLERIKATNVPVDTYIIDRAGNIAETQGILTLKNRRKGSIVCTKCGGCELSRNILLPDGTVLMCCMDYGMDHVLGNLDFDTYEEISEGRTKQELRMRLLSEKNGTILCRNCLSSEKALLFGLRNIKEKISSVLK